MKSIVAPWRWFIDGLTDATMTGLAALHNRSAVVMALDGGAPVLCDVSGNRIGRITQFAPVVSTDPLDLCQKIAGSDLTISVPDALVVHRSLSPIAAESAPFLDTFVRHQIERVTPWKTIDTYFAISTTRLSGKPARLAVTVHVVARRIIDDAIAAARALRPASLRLSLPDCDGLSIAVPIDDDRGHQRGRVRKAVQVGIVAAAALFGCVLAYFPWQIVALQSQMSDVESHIADQQAALSELRGGGGGFGVKNLMAQREARPRVVETIEALSAALPDDDYLTGFSLSGDQLHISGVSRNTADLVPALEGSKHFRAVSFDEAITRVQQGDANTFHLSMRLAVPKREAKR